jgi:hypothetical protein
MQDSDPCLVAELIEEGIADDGFSVLTHILKLLFRSGKRCWEFHIDERGEVSSGIDLEVSNDGDHAKVRWMDGL